MPHAIMSAARVLQYTEHMSSLCVIIPPQTWSRCHSTSGPGYACLPDTAGEESAEEGVREEKIPLGQ